MKTKTAKFEWTRTDALALAQQSCSFCYGLGLRPGRNGTSKPCNCVFRAIFRACYERFRYCVDHPRTLGRTALEFRDTATGPIRVWGLPHEEYMADFCLVSRRTLTVSEHRLFRFHYLLAGDWKLCSARLALDRGEFFHEVYRIQQKLGRVFRELQPHALFPLDEYFHTVVARREARVGELAAICAEDEQDEQASLTPHGDFYPLRKAAPEDDKAPRAAKAAA